MHSLRKNMLAIHKLGHLWLQKQMLILQCLMNTPPNVQNFNLKRQIMIQDHINKYVNFLSTNKMKSDKLISQKVHINLKIQIIHTMMILIVVDFNLHGLNRPSHIKIPDYAPAYTLLIIPTKKKKKGVLLVSHLQIELDQFVILIAMLQ